MKPWREIADRVFIRRFAFFDQTIGAIVGRDRVLVIDTRSTLVQARELLDDLRHVSALPHVVLNTHAHFDHVLGNAAFRPCEIWGEDGCARFMRERGLERRAGMAAEMPADGRRPPRLAGRSARPDIRPARLPWTSADAAWTSGSWAAGTRTMTSSRSSPTRSVVFAGDLVEEGAPPSFGDAFPLDWPATLGQLLDASGEGQVVPGHGEVVDRDFVAAQLADIAFLAEMARRQWPDLRAAGHDPAGPAPEFMVADVARHLGWPARAGPRGSRARHRPGRRQAGGTTGPRTPGLWRRGPDLTHDSGMPHRPLRPLAHSRRAQAPAFAIA